MRARADPPAREVAQLDLQRELEGSLHGVGGAQCDANSLRQGCIYTIWEMVAVLSAWATLSAMRVLYIQNPPWIGSG
jgi:hypothetical protein